MFSVLCFDFFTHILFSFSKLMIKTWLESPKVIKNVNFGDYHCPHPKDGARYCFHFVHFVRPHQGVVSQSQVFSQVSGPISFPGGYCSPGWEGTPFLAERVPQSWLRGTPRQGYPLARAGVTTQLGLQYPPPARTGVLPPAGKGYPPSQGTCYAAGGMPRAVSRRRTFLWRNTFKYTQCFSLCLVHLYSWRLRVPRRTEVFIFYLRHCFMKTFIE